MKLDGHYSRYEIKDKSQTGSLETELRIVGSGAGGDDDVTFADGSAFTCSFHYSDSEIYTATSTVNFYCKYSSGISV